MVNSSVRIRQAEHRDTLQVLNLMTTYIVDFYKQPKPNDEELKGLIEHLLNHSSDGLQYVAEKDGELIGFATMYFTFSTLKVKRQAILNDLFVAQSARGQKIGEQLFDACLSYIREHDFSSMTWETAKDNHIAQSLYEKMGGIQSEWVHYEMK